MKFPYLVKHDGVYYPIGTDVPIEKPSGGVTAPTETSGKVEEVKEDDVVTEDKEMPFQMKYTEEELNVPFQNLKKMCKENGIKFSNKDGADVLRQKLRAL